jgi:hypothetical protein
MPPSKKANGISWETLHRELQTMRGERKQDMGEMEGRISSQVTALSLRFDAFAKETSDFRHETSKLLAELVTGSNDAHEQRKEFDGDIRGLKQGLADYKLESARGDKRVGAISALVTAALSTIAAWIGTSR